MSNARNTLIRPDDPQLRDRLLPLNLLPALLHTLMLMAETETHDAIFSIIKGRRGRTNARSLSAKELGLFENKLLLQALSCVAHLHPNRLTRQVANHYLQAVAAQHGLSLTQLEDQLVPPCGLEAAFDYGPRRFRLVLGYRHTPLLREASGRMRTSMPRPRSSDQAALVTESRAHWRTHKRMLALMSRAQSARFEQAMITEGRWLPNEFSAHILAHPLLGQLAHRVMWGGYDEQGQLLEAFCPSEDGSLVNEQYQTVQAGQYAQIGIPHPVEVEPERRQRWAEMLHDFHTLPLFPQTSRPVYMLTAAEQRGSSFTRFALHQIETIQLTTGLSQQGWIMADKETSAVRFFGDLPTIARVTWRSANGTIAHLSHCGFERVFARGEHLKPEEVALPLADIPPTVVSEVLWQLTQIIRDPRVAVE